MPQPSRRSVLGMLGATPLAAASGVLASTGTAHTEASPSAGIPADLQPGGKFDRFVEAQAAKGQFSGNVLLAHQGEPVLERSYGMANHQKSIPNREDTIFALASMVKMVTSVAVAQLVQAGKLSYHETLGTYLEGFPADIAKSVTLHQLLTHTSGVGGPNVQQKGDEPKPAGHGSLEEAMAAELARIRRLPLQFTPGTKHAYSNDGFLVLSAIVAKVAGGSFYDYVREHIFSAAGMSRTDYLSGKQVLANDDIAHPYTVPQGGGEPVDGTTSPQFGLLGKAASAYATVSDLLGFARALQDGTLLEPSFAELITAGKVPVGLGERPDKGKQPDTPPRSSNFYGYGFGDHILNGQQFFGHNGGGSLGHVGQLDVFPDLDWVAVILTNSTPAPDTGSDEASAGARLGAWIGPILELEQDLITRQGA